MLYLVTVIHRSAQVSALPTHTSCAPYVFYLIDVISMISSAYPSTMQLCSWAVSYFNARRYGICYFSRYCLVRPSHMCMLLKQLNISSISQPHNSTVKCRADIPIESPLSLIGDVKYRWMRKKSLFSTDMLRHRGNGSG